LRKFVVGGSKVLLETVRHNEEDRRIPTLAAVLDPVELGKCLDQILPVGWGILRNLTVHVLEHHRGSRCTVDITLQTTTGSYGLIGKVYANDRPDVYRVMKQISQSGFGPTAEFSIPQPLTYVPAKHLLLQEKVQGPLAQEIFLHGNDQFRAMAAERCARWLAHFHAMDAREERTFNLGDHLVFLERWTQKIAALKHSLEDKANRLLKQLQTAAAAVDSAEACAGHGSYSHRQIILAENRTVTFDWDGYCIADPSRDVARFIVALRRLALGRLGSIRALDETAKIFQRTYVDLTKSRSTARLSLYEATICLEFAGRVIYQRVPRWQMKVEALIDEGLRILEQDG
jgi:aminoglycoside phosphotransferase (APT) family kinase protein